MCKVVKIYQYRFALLEISGALREGLCNTLKHEKPLAETTLSQGVFVCEVRSGIEPLYEVLQTSA